MGYSLVSESTEPTAILCSIDEIMGSLLPLFVKPPEELTLVRLPPALEGEPLAFVYLVFSLITQPSPLSFMVKKNCSLGTFEETIEAIEPTFDLSSIETPIGSLR